VGEALGRRVLHIIWYPHLVHQGDANDPDLL
jgi:hypothetical protein